MPAETPPLDGILVVTLEQAVAAPVCTSRLATAGARVIKVERPEGDFARGYDDYVKGEATYFVWANHGKESICLNLKEPEDLGIMENMLAQADVFVQNLAVGAADRLGLGSDNLRTANPRLITVSISGYGETGPYKNMKAYDMLIQAESGLSGISGGGRMGVSIADTMTGVNAYGAVLEALGQREKTGHGSHLSLSLFDSMTDLMAVPLLQQDYTGRPPKPMGMNHPSIVPYGAFPTRDGVDVIIAIQNEREWKRLCEDVLGLADLVQDTRFMNNRARTQNRDVLVPMLNAVTSAMPQSELSQKLLDADIAHSTANELPAVLEHPAYRQAGVTLPDGQSAKIPAPPAKTDWRQENLGPVPELGAQTKALRKEFSGP